MSLVLLAFIIFSLWPTSLTAKDTGFHDQIHRSMSKRVEKLGIMMDSLLSDKGIQENFDNNTRMRLSYNFQKFEGQAWSTQPEIKLRLRLPKTERSFQLIIDSAIPGRTSDNSDIVAGTTTERQNQEVNAALRYLSQLGEEWSAYFDTGVRLKIPIEMFARTGISRDFDLGTYTLVFSQELNYYINYGFGSITNMNLDRQISKKLFFQFINRLQWNNDSEVFDSTHGPSLIHQLSDRDVFGYYALGRFDNAPLQDSTEAYALKRVDLIISYRRRVYKDWLFFEARPQLSFPRFEGWKKEPSIFFKFEVAFGGEFIR